MKSTNDTKCRKSGCSKKRVCSASVACLLAVITVLCVTALIYIQSRSVIFVISDGTAIGYLRRNSDFDPNEFTDEINRIYQEISDKFAVNISPQTEFEFNSKFFGENTKLPELKRADMNETVTKTDSRITSSYAVFVNGQYIADVSDEEEARAAISRAENEICILIKSSIPDTVSAEAANSVTFEERLCPANLIVDGDKLFYILAMDDIGITHEHPSVKLAEAMYEISEKNNARDSEYYTNLIDLINTKWIRNEKLREQKIDELTAEYNAVLASEKAPDISSDYLLSPMKFTVTRSETVYESIEFETEYTQSDERYVGYSFTAVPGESGIRHAEYIVTYTGADESREMVSQEILKEPKPATVINGTKEHTEPGTITGKLIWPLETSGLIVSSFFGENRDGLDEQLGYHAGMDLFGAKDNPAWAADGGTVSYAGELLTYGNAVIIDHGKGLQTVYAHLGDISVSQGQAVSQGQIIGHIGKSGLATDYHLHFEVRSGSTPVDPLGYLPAISFITN